MHSVSIVTPSFNQGRFIERTIQSVLSQEFSGTLEYFVMDGGSTDDTVEILKRYGDRLTWTSGKDRGQADAVNKGLLQAKGEIIGWLNSDDIYYPGAIEAACNAFAEHPQAGAVYGKANHIGVDDEILEPYPTEPWDYKRLLDTCYLCQPAVFFRRSVVQQFGPLDVELQYSLDYEYWIRLASKGVEFCQSEQVLAGSRLYAETKTLGSRVKVHREINTMLARHAGRVPDRWLYNYAHAVLDDQGVPRTDGTRFPLRVAAQSICASLRWNHWVSVDMAKTTGTWIAGGIRNWRSQRTHA